MTQLYRAVLALFVLSLIVSQSTITTFAQNGDIDPNGVSPQSCITVPMSIRYRDTDATTNGSVSMVQEFLISKGYMNTEATGYFGSITFASVKKYQTAKGLTASGYVGPLTRAAIHTDSCSSDPTAGQNPNTTTSTNTNTNTTTTNTTTTTSAPTSQATGVISSTGGTTGCTVVLGANTCPVTVQWSSLNYAGSPAPYLAACQLNSSGICATTATQYTGATGSRLFNLSAGANWLFALWGTNYLGQLFKTDQLILKGACATGVSGCTSSSTPTNQFVVGPGTTSGTGSGTGTYAWYAWAGSMLLTQTPTNLGFAQPTVACTASNVGATYYLGAGQVDGKPVVAKCLAPGQGLTDFVPLTSSTLNQPGSSIVPTGLTVSVSNSKAGPYTATALNSGTIYSRITGLVKANNPKGCASPKGATGCLTVNSTTYRDFTSTEWGTSTTMVITVTNGGTFPNGEYDSYISYPNQAATKVGTFGIWAVNPNTYTGPVYGAGPGGIPGNANITYSWYVWTGPYTLWQGVWNLNYGTPSVACTASNVGATYYLGKGNDNRDIVAKCYASDQQMDAAFTPVTASTLNQPGANQSVAQAPTAGMSVSATTVQVDANFTAYFTMTNSPTSGDLKLDDRVIHFDSAPSTSWTGTPSYLGFAAGSHTLSFRACNTSGCSAYSAPVSITVTTTPPPTSSCTWTTGSFPATNPTTNWACGSAECTGAPAGSGWINQNNGCYHQSVSNTSPDSGSGSGYGSGNYEQP